MIGFGQQTYVPDTNFEQALINLGYDTGAPNGYIPTSNINTIIYLNINSENISDLTGIEDFTALIDLHCYNNQLTSLDVSTNTALITLYCYNNQLTSLDVSTNTALITLYCNKNQLTSLDVSNNTALTRLYCYSNQLTSLDVRNGNNNLLDTMFSCLNNYNLTCINVDNAAWASANWTMIDPQHYFSNNCPPSSIEEHTTNKELLRTVDVLGRETKGTKNEPLFYIYDDETVEKRIIIE